MGAADSVRRIMSGQKLAQLASMSMAGPRVFSVWYAYLPDRDAIIFASNRNRNHSREWVADPRVGGTVTGEIPDGLGDKVEAVSFFGEVRELSGAELTELSSVYGARWPNAEQMFPLADVESGTVDMRFYLIEVSEWVLFSEVDFPHSPRQSVPVPK
ncbi:pyridoxamine 5'-phosphate oxidase family protein [Nocardioides speluncae]|uniref:pyridoxamine 5'-phosphate oxidase family protein n=1 Tax=Nocardioides speluncae TaxID=2670337 RepID=UPI000D698035|nr:pyridoxamine 5'-phosphate oxidase family protein [Nocardioides speluncae]